MTINTIRYQTEYKSDSSFLKMYVNMFIERTGRENVMHLSDFFLYIFLYSS